MNARKTISGAVLLGVVGMSGCASHPPASASAGARSALGKSGAVLSHKIKVTDLRSTSPNPSTKNGLAAALAEKAAAFERALNNPSAKPTDGSGVQFLSPPAAPVTPRRRARVLANNAPAANAAPAVIAATPPKSSAKPQAAQVASATLHPEPDSGPTLVPVSSDFAQAVPHSTDDFSAKLANRLRADPTDLSAQLDYQLYEMLRDGTQSKWMSTSDLPPDDRELVAAVVDGISNLRSDIRQDSNAPMSKLVKPIIEMAQRARADAGLSINNMTLCRRVDGFGKYDPIDPARFPAGQANPVLVYCELSNFKSRLDSKHQWKTQLAQQVTVFTDTGIMVWKDKQRPVTDECRDRRNDFFLYDLVTLPPNLTIGRYLVKLTIIDKLANRVNESSVPVEIVGR